VGVETAMRKADILHDVGDARAGVAASTDGARGGPHDLLVRGLLAAGSGPVGSGSAHMMAIIYQSITERKSSILGRTWGTGAVGMVTYNTTTAYSCRAGALKTGPQPVTHCAV